MECRHFVTKIMKVCAPYLQVICLVLVCKYTQNLMLQLVDIFHNFSNFVTIHSIVIKSLFHIDNTFVLSMFMSQKYQSWAYED